MKHLGEPNEAQRFHFYRARLRRGVVAGWFVVSHGIALYGLRRSGLLRAALGSAMAF